jgi:dTDP-4-dehydrorhamnose reductase
MRIALVGARGQLGTALSGVLQGDLLSLGSDALDIASAEHVRARLDAEQPRLVVNAAAYNFVDRAEDEPELAFGVNALGARNLAAWCGANDVPLVHVSTDYVFGDDATRRSPYTENDLPGPLGAYAVSKLAGETFVRSLSRRHYVIRTCGLYGKALSPGKGNFVETMLRLGRDRDSLNVVDDQWCTPTSALDLARAISRLITTEAYGLYHGTSSGETTWFRFAQEIFRLARLNVAVRPITTAEYPTKARRPAWSVLDSRKLAAVIGKPLPSWQESLAEYLANRSNDGPR